MQDVNESIRERFRMAQQNALPPRAESQSTTTPQSALQRPRILWYLATPYTASPLDLEEAFNRATSLAAVLLDNHIDVFCPIAHGHALAAHIPDTYPHERWMHIDRPFMQRCDGLLVAMQPGWERSEGMMEEMRYFCQLGKPIFGLHDFERPRHDWQPLIDRVRLYETMVVALSPPIPQQ